MSKASDTVGRYEITKAVKRASGCRTAVVQDILEHLISFMRSSLVNGKRVEFRRFGALEPVVRKPKQIKNARAPGGVINVPSRIVVRFSASDHLSRQLNSAPGQE